MLISFRSRPKYVGGGRINKKWELKKRNVKWYKLGPRPYLKTFQKSSEKEISIAEFKNGFSTHTFQRPIIEFNLKT